MGRRRPGSLQEFSGINITPLMDLTFLLLIVFMITAPMMEYSVDVSPPQLNASRIDETESLLINLNHTGEVMIDNRQLDREQLSNRLADLFSSRPDTTILIRGHQERPYREVIGIMRIARGAGFRTVSLITQAEE